MVRRAEQSDIDSIFYSEKISFSSPLSEEDIRQILQNSLFEIYIIEDDTGFAGHIVLYTIDMQTEITSVSILPEKQKKRLGYRLLQEIIEKSKIKSVDKIMLEVRASNIAAISLYKKCGFKILAQRKNFYEKPTEDALTMVFETNIGLN